MEQAGWKFTVVNRERYLVRVGVVDLEQAKVVALKQCERGRINTVSAFRVKLLGKTGGE